MKNKFNVGDTVNHEWVREYANPGVILEVHYNYNGNNSQPPLYDIRWSDGRIMRRHEESYLTLVKSAMTLSEKFIDVTMEMITKEAFKDFRSIMIEDMGIVDEEYIEYTWKEVCKRVAADE